MKRHAVPATRRDRALPKDALPPEFVRRASTLAHRAGCNRDAVDCAICCEHAAAIADAKWALNHTSQN